MRIFEDGKTMIREVERDLFELGTLVKPTSMQDKKVEGNEDYFTKDLSPYAYRLLDTSRASVRVATDYMKIPWEWVQAEGLERVGAVPMNPGEAWKHREAIWTEYLHDGKFAYTYSERIDDQLEECALILMRDLMSRQAMVTIYRHDLDQYNTGGRARVPCSLSYQFLYRHDALHCLYVMRSCDFLTHFAADVAFASALLEHVSNKVGVKQGSLSHVIGSLHAYHKDMKARGIF